MVYQCLADATVLLHLAFVGFVVLGGLLVLRRRRWAWLHLPAWAWGTYIEISHGLCPLTPLEKSLRASAGQAGYGGGFIEHYLLRLLYPPGLQPWQQTLLAAVLLGTNAVLYAFAFGRRAGSGDTAAMRKRA